MASMYTSDGHLARAIFVRIILVAVTTAIIVSALPRRSSPELSYQVGRPWTQSALIAPYDIPVLKTDAVQKAERDSVMKLLSPYFNYDPSVSTTQIKRFMARNNNGIEGLPKSFLNTVSRKLQEIYSVGIVRQEDVGVCRKDSLATIQVVRGKTTSKKYLRNVFTPLTAYEYFFSDPQMLSVRAQLQQCNINDYLVANLKYNKELSEKELEERIKNLSQNSGLVYKGEKIIDRGDIVSEEDARRLQSYVYVMSKNDSVKASYVTLVGQVFFVMFCLAMLTIYLHLFRGDYFSKPRSMSMIYILVTLFPVVVSMMVRHGYIADYVYILPYAMLPILIRVFLDSRTAVMAHFTMVVLCALPVTEQYSFVMIELLSGVIAIYMLRDLQKRSQIIWAAFMVTLTAILLLWFIHLMLPGSDIQIDMIAVKFIVFSGFFILLLYPLMFLVEKLFGFTSAVTLFELSDTNKDLLRQLSEEAPGTFQHSITVGNIAAAVAAKIGAKSLLVRTGALYHDIGKITSPVFFTENQNGVSPHDRMTPIESAQIIISHVTEGMRLAEKHGLPDVICNFILTHHGAGMAKYFYITYKNAHPDVEVDTKYFTYPGPNPFTKEQAILMMTDSVEAASHSLKEYTEETITELVNRIVDSQVAEGYFRECPITFRDIAVAKTVMIDKLKSIYHTRISYPELKK